MMNGPDRSWPKWDPTGTSGSSTGTITSFSTIRRRPVFKMAKEQSVDEIGLATDINHALWTLHGRGALDGQNRDALKTVVRALNHPSAGVRRNAVLVLPRDDQSTTSLLQSGILRDKNPRVR